MNARRGLFLGLVLLLAALVAACGGAGPAATPTAGSTPTAAPTPTAPPAAGPFTGQRWQEAPVPDGTKIEETGPDTATLIVSLDAAAAEDWFQTTWSADGFKLATKGTVQQGMSYNFIKGEYIYSCIFPAGSSGSATTVYLEREKR